MNEIQPHNLEAERAVLGAVVMHNDCLADALRFISPDDFYRSAHRWIFEGELALSEKGVEIDLITLKDTLVAAGRLDDVGGPAYLAGLIDGVPRSVNVAHYAEIVAERSSLRQLIAGATKILKLAQTPGANAKEILNDAERELIGLSDTGSKGTGLESMRTIALRGMEQLEERFKHRQAVSGVPSGFTELDEITRGFQPGTLVTLAARPGIGKSSLASNISQYAGNRGYWVANFSLEMSKEEIFFRQVSSAAEIDSHRITTGYLGELDWAKISVAISQIAESRQFVEDKPSIGVMEIRAYSRRTKAEHGLNLIIIDYLQLMSGAADTGENRALEIGTITRSLKQLARELSVPVLLLSQLNREPEKRGNKPRLSDLKQSGSIEEDSDIVMFLHRTDESEQTSLIIEKHRNGPQGVVPLQFLKHQTRYINAVEAPATRYEDRQLPIGDR